MHCAPHFRTPHPSPTVHPRRGEPRTQGELASSIPTSHLQGRPRSGQGGGPRASGAGLLARLTAPPRRGLSQHRVLGQARLSRARLTAKDRGLMRRQDRFTAAERLGQEC